MRFFNLLKKELAELINAQAIASIVFIMVLFYVLGNVMQSSVDTMVKQEYSINLSDQDRTDLTKEFVDELRAKGAVVKEFTTSGDDYADILESTEQESLIIIPEGFTAAVEKGETPTVISLSGMKSAAMLSNLTNSTSGGIGLIEQCLSDMFSENYGLTAEDIQLINQPVKVSEKTVVGSKSADISAAAVMSSISSQSMLLPIIIFLLITLASQGIMNSIANEKIDKTLETLLSTPVSRTTILVAKMLAAAIVALLNAVCYMIGFSSCTKMATNTITGTVIDTSSMMSVPDALNELGLNLNAGDYVLVGIQLFLTIMICLSISLVLGALVNDSKQTQTMTMPLMFLAIIPYLVSMFADINSLPTVLRYIIYAIPFTHTFSAISNISFGHMGLFFAGMAYQAVFFVICLLTALKVFKSDKILTISLNFGQKKKAKKVEN